MDVNRFYVSMYIVFNLDGVNDPYLTLMSIETDYAYRISGRYAQIFLQLFKGAELSELTHIPSSELEFMMERFASEEILTRDPERAFIGKKIKLGQSLSCQQEDRFEKVSLFEENLNQVYAQEGSGCCGGCAGSCGCTACAGCGTTET